MLQFLIFICIAYTLSYLQADAKIFGCSTQSYIADPEDTEFLRNEGIAPFRLWVLRHNRFARKLLSCYFCLGVWNGPLAQLVLFFYGQHNPAFWHSYFLGGQLTLSTALWGCIPAALIAPTTNYLVDMVISVAESWTASS
jgi:hypothetical protein